MVDFDFFYSEDRLFLWQETELEIDEGMLYLAK